MRKLLLALTGAMLSFYSFADLGEIKVKSYLSQPLNATIPITGVSEANLSELSIGLANSTKFKNNGISFNPELGSLQFKIMNLKNAPYLQITSTRAISSPVLNILLHYQQNTDDFYRQYTLLLDPIELNDAVVTKVSNNSSRAIIKREIVLHKITGEKPIAISNNTVAVNTVPSNKNSFVMNLSNPEVVKQLSSFNADSMIFTTRKDDSLYTVARFEQLIYPNAQFSLNQIIVALGLENYPKLKPLTQIYESGFAIALPLPQDVNLIQAKLADQYLLDSTLSSSERLRLLTGIASLYDKSLKIESSELFIGNSIKNNLVKPNVKKPFITTQALVVADESFLDVLFENKYYLMLSLLIILGVVLFRKNIRHFLIRKRILSAERDTNLYSAAAIASKNAQRNSNNQESNKLNSEPYDFLNTTEPQVTENMDTLDGLSSDFIAPLSETPANYKYVDEELISTLENILAFDESRDDIRYKLFELYLSANRLQAASAAYFKLDKSLESDSHLRESLLELCLQYEFVPGVTIESVGADTELSAESNSQLDEKSVETEAFIPSVADLSTQQKAQILSQLNVSNLNVIEPETTVNSVINIDDSASSLDFTAMKSPSLVSSDSSKQPVMDTFSEDRILDFSPSSVKSNIIETVQVQSIDANESHTFSDKPKFTLDDLSFADDNDGNTLIYDERLNLAQMYYQIEEFVKAREILTELINTAEVSSEIKICAQQLLNELKLNG